MIRQLRVIAIEARFDASRDDVWNALTNAVVLGNWFAPFIKADEKLGGIVEMSWDAKNAWPTTIEIWEPGEHLRWADPAPTEPVEGEPEPRLITDWLISSEGGQTVLRLVQSGFGEGAMWDDQIDGLLGGWLYFMWNLGYCLTRHAGVPRMMVSTRKKVGVSRQQFWDSFFASGLIGADNAAPKSGDACRVTIGETYDAVVQTADVPYRFAARIPALNDALLFIELEGKKEKDFHTGFWLSTYGLDAEKTGELQRALDAAVGRMTEPTPAPTL